MICPKLIIRVLTYIDIAIGAPGADTVYIYQAYPVVKFVGRIFTESSEIKMTDISMELKACWSLRLNSKNERQPEKSEILFTYETLFGTIAESQLLQDLRSKLYWILSMIE